MLFEEKIERYSKFEKPKIAVGIFEIDEEVLRSIDSAKRYADILVVGPPNVGDVRGGFNVLISKNPEHKLAEILAKDEVEGIVRGTIDDLKTYKLYSEMTGEDYSAAPGLIEDPDNRQFFLSPLSNSEGWVRRERYNIASNVACFVKKWNVDPRIAVFEGVRKNTYIRKKGKSKGVEGKLNKTFESAEWIVEKLTTEGYHAKNWTIDLNVAIDRGYNVIVPVNGMVGNQIFRTALFCGGRVLAVPRLGLSSYYEDNSRTEKDFESHIQWLSALINKP